jgi:TonB family protein
MDAYLWLELLVRSTVLLVCGELVLQALRRAHASVRHRFIVCVLGLLALLPLFLMILPEVSMPSWKKQPPPDALVTAMEASSNIAQTTAHGLGTWLLLGWAAGVVLTALPFLVGAMSVRKILRRAEPFTDGVMLSQDVHVPVTCGFTRPRIVLPVCAKHWSALRFEAVLLHERAHIQRRDLLTQTTAQIVACLWWFQPIAWVMRWRLRTESEFACDAEALRSGLRASDYASELLGIARTAGSYLVPASTIGMCRSSNLEDRTRAVLYPSKASVSLQRICALGFILAVASIAASTITFGQNSQNQSGGLIMKRTLLSALLSSAGISAATLSGTVHDLNGAAIADANVTITNADTSARQQTATNADGKFTISGAGGGEFILRIDKRGFASIYREFGVKAESDVDRDFTMANEGGAVPEEDNFGASTGSKATRVGGRVAEDNLTHKVIPAYPVAAKENRIQGTVELHALISKDGVPIELRVVSSPSDELSANTLEAVRQWRYRPTLLNGNPVEISTTIVVNYTLAQ